MKKCIVCNGTKFKPHMFRTEYDVCNDCGLVVKRGSFTTQLDISEIYGKRHGSELKSQLKADKRHYMRFFERCYCYQFTNFKFNKIYSLGGGFPKLESFIDHTEIHVIDVCSDNYKNYIDDFRLIYNYKKPITYHEYWYDETTTLNESMLSMYTGKHNLITFIHFLEHLNPDVFDKLFQELLDYRGNATFLIYQPNCNDTRKKDWCH